MGNLRQILYLLYGSDLVVDHHNRHQQSVRSNGFFQLQGRNIPFSCGLQIGNLYAPIFQPPHAFQNCMVLERGSDHMDRFPTGTGLGFHHTFSQSSCHSTKNSPIISLCSTGSKIDLIGLRFQQSRYLFPAPVYCLFRLHAIRIDASRIAKLFSQIWLHGLKSFL